MEQNMDLGSWSLDELYADFSSEQFLHDFSALQAAAGDLAALCGQTDEAASVEAIRRRIDCIEKFLLLHERLNCYAYLRVQKNTADGDAATWSSRIDSLYAGAAGALADIRREIAGWLEQDIPWDTDEKLREYAFYFQNLRKARAHMLPHKEEDFAAKLNLTGARAWSRLFDTLTSTVRAVCDGKQYSLPEIRNLAYSEDSAVRQRAYEAELACYREIEVPVSFALCSIKKQANILAQRRGYPSVLEMNLDRSNMQLRSLDALLTAIDQYLPVFWRYLRAKAALLGHSSGKLPWYDLFAPMGRMDTVFSAAQAGRYLRDMFAPFSPDMGRMIDNAFQNRWIDFYPQAGKVGGAFCQPVPWLHQNRILTNFNGSFDSVVTLAHELGHAYHGMQIYDNLPLNRDYSMQLAETASTFNEIYLLDRAVKAAGAPEEKLFLLESLLMGNTQVICDIYSRFLFEKEVVARCQDEDLRPEALKAIMLSAQKKAYGEGLDPEILHPYMWACKVHYYIDVEDFYNFPYAFGALFSLGLYRMYLTKGADFVPQYNKLLHNTPMMDTEAAAASVGIDITTPAFWLESLEALADYVRQYEQLAQELRRPM